MARCIQASEGPSRSSSSLDSRRLRHSQAIVRSTTQRRGAPRTLSPPPRAGRSPTPGPVRPSPSRPTRPRSRRPPRCGAASGTPVSGRPGAAPPHRGPARRRGARPPGAGSRWCRPPGAACARRSASPRRSRGAPFFHRLHRLAVDDRRRRLGRLAERLPGLRPQRVLHPLPDHGGGNNESTEEADPSVRLNYRSPYWFPVRVWRRNTRA